MSHYHEYCAICGVQWSMHGAVCPFPAARNYYGHDEAPHKCPVCNGRGLVPPPAGYYNTTAEEPCNACKGAGVLWR